MKGKRRIIVLGVIVIFILAIIFNTIFSGRKNNTDIEVIGNKDGLFVNVGMVKVTDIVNSIDADGQVVMKNKDVVYSPRTALVDIVNFDVSDNVKKGDVLISYNNDSLEKLNDELEIAKLDLKASELALKNITIPASAEQVLQLESQLRINEDSIKLAKKQIENIDLEIENTNKLIKKAQDNLADGKILYANGGISFKEVEELENKVTSIENTLKGINLEREIAVSSVNSAENTYNDTKIQIDLLNNKNSNQSVLNQIEAQKINIEKIKINIKSLEKEISEFTADVIAENDGVILSKNVEAGTTVQKDSTLFIIGSTNSDNLIVKVDVHEYDSGELAIGEEAIITGESLGDNEIKGIVSKIYPIIEEKNINSSQKKVVVTEIEVKESDLTIRVGSTVSASIITSIDKATTVIPIMALATDENAEDYVLVIKEDFSVEKRIVDIGKYADSNVSVSNVTAGEKVILDPPINISEGDFVNYIDTTVE